MKTSKSQIPTQSSWLVFFAVAAAAPGAIFLRHLIGLLEGIMQDTFCRISPNDQMEWNVKWVPLRVLLGTAWMTAPLATATQGLLDEFITIGVYENREIRSDNAQEICGEG